MEVLELLEKKIETLLERLRRLEAENNQLKQDLKKEREIKDNVSKRIDILLKKMEDIDID